MGYTFCYFSGMTLAVVAILGHFSKTLLLFQRLLLFFVLNYFRPTAVRGRNGGLSKASWKECPHVFFSLIVIFFFSTLGQSGVIIVVQIHLKMDYQHRLNHFERRRRKGRCENEAAGVALLGFNIVFVAVSFGDEAGRSDASLLL